MPEEKLERYSNNVDYSEEGKLSEDSIITIHRIIEKFGNKSLGINKLHKDLFDSRTSIVLSALSAIEKIGDKKSIEYVSRLFSHKDELIQCAAVKTSGIIGTSDLSDVLIRLFKTTQSEKLRCEVLLSLSKLAPKDSDVLTLIKHYSSSHLASPETRVFTTGLLLKLDRSADITDLISHATGDVFDRICSLAKDNNKIKSSIIKYFFDKFDRLSINNRISLISILSPFSSKGSMDILVSALKDTNPKVRKAAYNIIGQDTNQVNKFDIIIEILSNNVESDPIFEEDVYQAIDRMEKCLKQGMNQKILRLKEELLTKIQRLYRQITLKGRNISSNVHEIGWLLVKSREYIEYYADEYLRNCIVGFLKGSSNYSKNEIIRSLKNSAVKVEVRHFDGYKALMDIVKNPKRHGIALISREIALARLGKRKVMYSLIRNIRLIRLLPLYKDDDIFIEIYNWSKEAKLYRLAEAALFALAKVDVNKTMLLCKECIKPPVFSKILAIATVHLLKDLDWTFMESSVIELLKETNDSYILINLIDSLFNINYPFSQDMIKTLLNRLQFINDQEIISKIAELIGEKADFGVFDILKDIYNQSEDWKNPLILADIEQMVSKGQILNMDGLKEFLYKILRTESSRNRNKAAVILWKIGDDYSLKIIKSFIVREDIETKIDIVRGLKNALKIEIIPDLISLLYEQNSLLQETLRETLLSTDDQAIQKSIVELAFQDKSVLLSEIGGKEAITDKVKIDFLKEKSTYKFEKEHIEKLAVFFTDIKGYSEKSEILSSMELASLIHDYESILLPIINTHYGELIKKMGDGHLFIFKNPLNAVVAAIRLQKAMKRFNTYREERMRINIRVGVNWGDVIRKDNDIFGNTVNLASRLEHNAKEGSILVSVTVQKQVKDYIHSRDLGVINVKGFNNPVNVFEPYEIVIDFPEKLDPLKAKPDDLKRGKDVLQCVSDKQSQVVSSAVNRDIIKHVQETFISLNNLCKKLENGETKAKEIRKELMRRWNELKIILKKSQPT